MRTRMLLLAGVGAVAILATGCGDDGGGDGADDAIEATATDFEFEPDDWTVPAGDFSLELTNDGAVDHEFVIMNEEIDSEADFAEDLVLDEVEAPPGETVDYDFTVDEAGTYQVLCALEGHFDAGMEGTLTVE